ncbi:MAG: putative ribosomal N-acetyltransferase YdaF [candidate division WS2 bacterium]|uniref:Ribosomal N-acetyltransferase YdaF n=1 Tax=Psychracetigena formicireducens TaxID=2986056 RepID=A0A9E2BI58_PSYF1|nr:putative ribosomal N-acetyltransferase YdaF [Candidatus Psychracetigena formicireducens]
MIIEEIFGNLTRLETKRLILRKMTLYDAQDMYEYASDPEVAKYVTWDYHRSIDDSISFLKSTIQKYDNKEVSEWGIIYKKSNKFIGTCGYLWWSLAHSRAEIAYTLSRRYWNKGLMTEAVKEVIKYGFEKMVLNRIEARCMVRNIASQRVMEKFGMKSEGIMREVLFVKLIFYSTT